MFKNVFLDKKPGFRRQRFKEHTEMCWWIDQFFKNKYRPVQ